MSEIKAELNSKVEWRDNTAKAMCSDCDWTDRTADGLAANRAAAEAHAKKHGHRTTVESTAHWIDAYTPEAPHE